MINSRKTLTNLHKKFPNLSLDSLFDILDCIEEDIYNTTYFPSINQPNPYKTDIVYCNTTK